MVAASSAFAVMSRHTTPKLESWHGGSIPYREILHNHSKARFSAKPHRPGAENGGSLAVVVRFGTQLFMILNSISSTSALAMGLPGARSFAARKVETIS